VEPKAFAGAGKSVWKMTLAGRIETPCRVLFVRRIKGARNKKRFHGPKRNETA